MMVKGRGKWGHWGQKGKKITNAQNVPKLIKIELKL